MPDKQQQQDPRFRKYVQLIERNLQSFDAVDEWADIISFLGRLLKSFQAYPQFKTIPHKHIVSKRLAQCLNPGFPAGVHQKTLEVYAYILETIGKQQLADDLPLWSVGLFPFIQYAATHVKPQLLNIFEKYYYPLGTKLRPAMRGLIIALLPALEEEGSEGFDKVVTMMDRLSDMVELPYFYSCVWLVMINDTSLRLPCLNYLLRRLPKITNTEDVALVLGGPDNIGLMVRAFSATITDQHLLVQRGMLELLVQNYSLQYRTLQHDDLVILARYALSIVLRKDMSLNRRLYAWLLGSDSTPHSQLKYFHHYAEKATTQAIQNLLFKASYSTSRKSYEEADDTSSLVMEAQKPYKILISLMDKWEIGQPLVNNIITDSFISLQGCEQCGLVEQEILQTANMWMEMVEPYLIWMKLFDVIDQSFPPLDKVSNSTFGHSKKMSLPLVEFTLKSFKFTDEEIKHMHLPLVLTSMTQKLQESLQHVSFTEILPQIMKCIDIILLILRQLPDSVFQDRQRKSSVLTEEPSSVNYQKEFITGMDALEYARDFYGVKRCTNSSTNKSGDIKNPGYVSGSPPVKISTSTVDQEDEGDLTSQRTPILTEDKSIAAAITRPSYGPIRGSTLLNEIVTNLIRFLAELVNTYVVAPDTGNTDGVDVGVDGKRLRHLDAQLEQVLHGVCSALTIVTKHTIGDNYFDNDGQINEQRQQLKIELTQTLLKCCQHSREFGVVDAGLSTLTQLIKQQGFLDGAILKEKHQTKQILNKLWGFLGPSTQLLHMRTVELLWLLTDTSVQHHVEAIVAAYLIIPDDHERMANYEKFGIFWELSENMVEASVVFSRPMFLMLDLLRDDNSPVNRRAAETWIRCHLKSYARLLEPFIITLLNRNIIRRPTEKNIPYVYQYIVPLHPQPGQQQQQQHQHLTISYFLYMRSFDMDIVDYMITTLTTLIQFGGVGVLKACNNYTVGTAGTMPSLIQSGLGICTNDHPNLTFLELLVHIAIRFLETEPCDNLQSKLIKSVRRIQLHASDLLYLIISKLDYVDMTITSLTQESVLKKLLFCISSGDLDIQPKLLHLLHATMAITAAGTSMAGHKSHTTSPPSSSPSLSTNTKRHQHRHRPSTTSFPMGDSISSSPFMNTSTMASLSSQTHQLLHRPQSASLQQGTQQEALKLARSTANLYVKCVTDAFHTSSNRPILSQWMDFVLVTLPHVRQGFRQVIVPILICLCEQVNLCNVTVRLLMHGAAGQTNGTAFVGQRTTSSNDNHGLNWKYLNDEGDDDEGDGYHRGASDKTRLPATTQPLIQERGAVIGGPETDILVFLNGLEKVLCFGITDRTLSDLWSMPMDSHHLNSRQFMMPRVEDHAELWGIVQLMMQHPAAPTAAVTATAAASATPTPTPGMTGSTFETGTTSTSTDTQTTSVDAGDKSKPRNALLFHLPVVLHILLDVWRVFRQPNWDQQTVNTIGCAKKDAVLQSFAYAADHVKARLETTFELLFRNCPSDTIEGFTEIFFVENPIALEYEVSSDHFQLIPMEVLASIPTSSPQQIITILLDSIRQRTTGSSQTHRKRPILRTGNLTDTSILRFAEIYCQEMIKAETLATMWPLVHSFAKEYLSQASSYKTFLPGLLRFLTVVLDGVMRFSDDKKMRKDAQDLYQRCVDYCILIAGRSFDQSLWLRGRTNAYDDDPLQQQHQHHDTLLSYATTTSNISSPFSTTLSLGSGNGTSTTLSSIQSTTGTELFFTNATGSSSSKDGTGNDGVGTGVNIIPLNLSTTTISDLEKKASWKSREDFMIIQVNHYLATNVIPQLRLLMGDQDRINSLLNNLVYYVIGPHLRSRAPIPSMPTIYKKHGSQQQSVSTPSSLSPSSSTTTTTMLRGGGGGVLHGGAVIVDQVVEMAKMPFTYKTWRKEVWDVFNEDRFFYITRTTALKWCKVLSTMFSLEKERFMELMGKIVTTATVNNSAFFTTSNKEHEAWQRALHLRRVSFVIFSGTLDQFVPQLPSLQEKIIGGLKLDHSEMMHVEIYLCLRILLIRFSQKHLVNFWPVLISELMRLFNHVLSNGIHDKPEEAQIALGGCKFLDLLCTLELDSFQVYQWIFIRDTVEAVIQREQPKTVEPTSTATTTLPIMDKLSDKLHFSTLSSSASSTSTPSALSSEVGTNNNTMTMLPMDQEGGTKMMTDWPHNTMTVPSTGELRRPMLTMHNIGSISQLDFFIHQISLYVYQSSYMLAKPDLPFIESLLLQDLLDGGDMRTE
ncbi:Dopey, N-terminal-domain-containing protein [Absidia repens]|uniref:Dopey, N-terminal-domain-containing protein n=1 Tax=Absidia repens TaxID=90262 RepID=A0A1X2IJR8_9FUNG|nr:Dopey, N-terminal-domain-containing protein [Absidia repens]